MIVGPLLSVAALGLLAGMVLGPRRPRFWLGATLVATTASLAAALTVLLGYAPTWDWSGAFRLGGELPHLRLDAIGALFLALLSVIGGAGAAYSRDYWSDHHYPRSAGRGRFWWSGLVLTMGLVLTQANGLHFLIAWELFTLCGYFLITLENRGRKVRAAGWLWRILARIVSRPRIADWLKNRDIPDHLPAPMALNALYVHVIFLLHQGEIARFLGTLEALPPESAGKSAYGAFSVSFLLAAGYALTGKGDKGACFLERAAEIGLPDGLLLHFAAFPQLFSGRIEKLLEAKHPHLFDSFRALRARFEIGWNTLHRAVSRDELPEGLTGREREISLLAAKGLRNQEIAAKLSVTESTVRTHLRAVLCCSHLMSVRCAMSKRGISC